MRALPPNALVLATIVVAALGAVGAPLLVYSLTLAALGLPHVLAELRYVDRRFGDRIGRQVGVTILLLLGAVVVVRLAGLSGFASVPVELVLVGGLAATTLPALRRGGPLALGIAVIAAIGWGIARAPLATLVVFAFLHNLTPVGFLAEALRGQQRRRTMALCLLAFGVVPLAIATGLPGRLAAAAGLAATDLTLLPTGPLSAHLGVFVPPGLRDASWAVHLFSAATYLQCLHYAVVLHVLPRLAQGESSTVLAWPRDGAFRLILVVAGGLFLAAFAVSFTDARALYGVFAAVHAWVEIPILLLAFAAPTLAWRASAAS